MDEDKALQQKLRAEHAEREYGETAKAFDAIEAEYTKLWKLSRDPVARENYWRGIQVIDEVRKHFRSVIGGGAIAARDLEQVGAPQRWRLRG